LYYLYTGLIQRTKVICVTEKFLKKIWEWGSGPPLNFVLPVLPPPGGFGWVIGSLVVLRSEKTQQNQCFAGCLRVAAGLWINWPTGRVINLRWGAASLFCFLWAGHMWQHRPWQPAKPYICCIPYSVSRHRPEVFSFLFARAAHTPHSDILCVLIVLIFSSCPQAHHKKVSYSYWCKKGLFCFSWCIFASPWCMSFVTCDNALYNLGYIVLDYPRLYTGTIPA